MIKNRYAVLLGVGTVLITLVSWCLFDQKLDLSALVGIKLIAAGGMVMNLLSRAMGH